MDKLFSLQDQVVVVTGGAGYLGSAMVQALLSCGAKVAVADRLRPDTTDWNKQDLDRLQFVNCDVSDTVSIRSMFSAVNDHFGQIDILVNNVNYGSGAGPTSNIEAMSDEDWALGVDGAAGTCFRCTREVIPYFKENKNGNIINIGSMYGLVSPDPNIYGNSGANNPINYGAGKAAVLQMTRYCAAHLAVYNIRVNSLSPGPFPDPAKQTDEAFLEHLQGKTMLGRIGKPRDIAGAVVFLASPASAFMTGSNLVVDGGWTAW